LVSLASDTFSASHIRSQTLLALPKSKPIQLFSVVSKFLQGILPHGVLNKIDDCACSFQSIGFQRVSCNGACFTYCIKLEGSSFEESSITAKGVKYKRK
jgi:hypothetical protein